MRPTLTDRWRDRAGHASVVASAMMVACLIAGAAASVRAADREPAAAAMDETTDRFITTRIQEVGEQLTAKESLADKLRRQLAKGEEGEGAKGEAGGVFTRVFRKDQPTPATPPSDRERRALALGSYDIQSQAAQMRLAEAAKLMRDAQAQEKSNPAYARHLKSLAASKVDDAAGWVQKAGNSLAVSAGTATGPKLIADAVDVDGFCKLACRQVMTIAGVGDKTFKELLNRGIRDPQPRLPLFDANSRPPGEPAGPPMDTTLKATPTPPPVYGGKNEPPAPAPPRRAGGAGREPRATVSGNDTLVLPGGVVLDLKPLKNAVAAVKPALQGKALFTACEGSACPSRDLLAMLAAPDTRAQLAKVGGVALDVTFDLLSASGMPEFSQGTDIVLVDRPVLISLKRLLAAVDRYHRPGEWDTLPEPLRFPGNVERLNGFVLDPASGDVILIGRPATDPSHRLDIDVIVLAVRQVWQKGETMAVSLDPAPDDPGGPQYPRVINVPADSIVAKIMLEADYAMKSVLMFGGFSQSERFIDVAAIADKHMKDATTWSRFWLTPRTFGRNAIHLSQSGRTALMEASVEARTEKLFLAGAVVHGSGSAGSMEEAQADAFNKAYPRLEIAPRAEPRGVFMRVRGLTDIVAVAKLLRATGVTSPVLERVAKLPYRHLTGADAIPSFFRGLAAFVPLKGGTLNLRGGMDLALRHAPGSARSYDDRAAAGLERQALNWPGGGHFARTASLSIVVPKGSAGEPREIDRLLLSAERAVERRDFPEALRDFRAAVAIDPLAPEAHAGLARVEMERGGLPKAAASAWRALVLAPGDESYRLLGYDIAWRHDSSAAFAEFDESARRELSRRYVDLARQANGRGRGEEALRLTDWAVDLWEDNGDAHFVRYAVKQMAGRDDGHDLLRAIRAFRRQVADGADGASKALAFVLTQSAAQRINRVTSALPTLIAGKRDDEQVTGGGAITADLVRAVDEAREAGTIDPGLPLGPGNEILAQALLNLFTSDSKPDSRPLLARADRMISRFPTHPFAYLARAHVHVLSDNWKAARADLDQAVAVAPTDGRVYATRATLEVGAGRCAQARAELAKLRTLSPTPALLKGIEADVNGCR